MNQDSLAISGPVELSYRQCRTLLTSSVVGRVAVCTPAGPRIIPVNHVVVGDSLVFRTTPYGVLGGTAWNSPIAFEVDEIDAEQQSGWSVVATGRGSLVEDPDELVALRTFRDPHPWASGSRLLYVRLRWDALTGRRVGARG
jgi:uncharacterized protein